MSQHFLDRSDFDVGIRATADTVEGCAGFLLASGLDEPFGAFGNWEQKEQKEKKDKKKDKK